MGSKDKGTLGDLLDSSTSFQSRSFKSWLQQVQRTGQPVTIHLRDGSELVNVVVQSVSDNAIAVTSSSAAGTEIVQIRQIIRFGTGTF
ncbi:MAG: hypothetical protein ACE3JK_09700 [Sporolactobacillus sp.]